MWSQLRRAALPTGLVVVLGTGCVHGAEEDDGTTHEESDDTGVPDPRGGPVGGVVDGEPILDVAGVVTEATENDTIELATRPSGVDDPMESAEYEARFRITFDSAQRGDDGVTFTGEAEYLHDEGGYELHSSDLTVLVSKDPTGSGGKEHEVPESGGSFEDQYEIYPSGDSEVVAELTADEPTGEFSVTFPDVPPENEDEAVSGQHYGRMVQYTTPGELWGYTVEAPPDFVPGRVCYVEGEQWHDIELFRFTDLPCSSV